MSEEQESSSSKEQLLVATKVKSYIKSKDCMSSGDVMDQLNEKIYKLLDEAIERTKANKRSTVKACDL